MLIGDLFKRCNKEITCNYISKEYIESDIFLKNDKKLKQKIYNKYLETLESLSSKEISITNNEDKVIICKIKEECFDNNEKQVYNTFLIKETEVLERKELLNETNFDFMTGTNLISLYSIDFIEWDNLLSVEISNKSLELYDLNELAGELLRLMTLFGFNEEDILERKNEIIAALKESEEESKRKQKYKSSDKVLDELYERFGMKRKIKTEEEKELNRKKLEKIITDNRIIINNFIKETIKEHL